MMWASAVRARELARLARSYCYAAFLGSRSTVMLLRRFFSKESMLLWSHAPANLTLYPSLELFLGDFSMGKVGLHVVLVEFLWPALLSLAFAHFTIE
ncbi:hypothetical protein RRG08_025792 [Elysia crispata]|uniref:Uncharacterized protein n=1 Tax=Elysia crispata TaxID=231223 RepID=A0AAE1CRQ4_9GAST|nr:hypothetical protein RRG08_025792 [Elysia crispata]